MEEKEIIEGNKLIVEFIGGKNYPDRYEKDGISCVDTPIRKFDGHSINTKNLKYHSSWDWLMPVVHKFKQLTQSHYLIFEAECTKQHIEHKKSIDLMLSFGGIEEVYKTLIDGIKWHNSQMAVGCSAKWDSK